jgi:hypothetical protein
VVAMLLQTECRVGLSANKMIGLVSHNSLNIWMHCGVHIRLTDLRMIKLHMHCHFLIQNIIAWNGCGGRFQSVLGGHNNWVCLPVSCILRVLEKVRRDRAVATLVVPWWEVTFLAVTACDQAETLGIMRL